MRHPADSNWGSNFAYVASRTERSPMVVAVNDSSHNLVGSLPQLSKFPWVLRSWSVNLYSTGDIHTVTPGRSYLLCLTVYIAWKAWSTNTLAQKSFYGYFMVLLIQIVVFSPLILPLACMVHYSWERSHLYVSPWMRWLQQISHSYSSWTT